MAVLESIKQLLRGTTTAINSLKKAETALRARLASLQEEEVRLLSLPAPRAEVEANLTQLIADLGRRWTDALGLAVIQAASGRVERYVGPATPPPPDTLQPGHLPDALVNRPVHLDAVAALYPAALLEGIHRVLQATPYEPGPPMIDRLQRLAAIESEREQLRREHAALADQATAAGLGVDHLPEEKAKRLQAAARHRAWVVDGQLNAEHYRRNPSARPPEPTES